MDAFALRKHRRMNRLDVSSPTITETFFLEFECEAFDGHRMPAAALAQSLLALGALARSAAEAAYGRGCSAEMTVKEGLKPGSFILDLVVKDPVQAAAGGIDACGVLVQVIALARWAHGKKVTAAERSEAASAPGEVGEAGASHIARFTQALEDIGADAVGLCRPAEKNTSKVIPKAAVHEVELLLEVTGANLTGGPNGWTFREVGEGLEFSATLEDESFLADVKNRRVVFGNGLRLRAAVRVVQRRVQRTVTERHITAVREIIPPSGN